MLIVLGNKNYSSWSLRPWLLLHHMGVPFEEKVIGLGQPGSAAEIAKYSSTGRVPVLIDGSIRVWDSLAIAEYLHEKFPDKHLWPSGTEARAVARSVTVSVKVDVACFDQLVMLNSPSRSFLPRRTGPAGDQSRVAALQRSG